MAWCCQAPSHYLSQCWPIFMSPYSFTRTQWVNKWNISVLWGYSSTVLVMTSLTNYIKYSSAIKASFPYCEDWGCLDMPIPGWQSTCIVVFNLNKMLFCWLRYTMYRYIWNRNQKEKITNLKIKIGSRSSLIVAKLLIHRSNDSADGLVPNGHLYCNNASILNLNPGE